MKQFNLDEYLKNPSRKVVTRNGRNVTIHCTNFNSCQPIIAQIEGHNFSYSFTKDGKYCIDDRNLPYDLFFAPEKHEGWINLYKHKDDKLISTSNPYDSEEKAIKVGRELCDYLTTIKIEWKD